jgi:ArsR family metal-binding transcriptional regulator
MTAWYCYKDKVAMEEKEVILSYMQMHQYIPGLKCPTCGEEYLTEEVATTIVQAAEDALEGK